MTIYSIDLGIDPAATHGHSGQENEPYPMQIGVSSGTIEEGNFVPANVSSWFMFRSGDHLLVRVFDLGDPSGMFGLPTDFDLNLYDLDGSLKYTGWTTTGEFVWTAAAATLCFEKPGSDTYPCYQLMVGQNFYLYPLEEVTTSLRKLLTVRAEAKVFSDVHPAPDGVSIHFKSDPELIVSPYGG